MFIIALLSHSNTISPGTGGGFLLDWVHIFRLMQGVQECDARTSQLVNYKVMADDTDIDQVTAKAWLGILEALGIVFLLHPIMAANVNIPSH